MNKAVLLVVLALGVTPLPSLAQQEQPNIVLVFMDNFGWGEIGAYGGGVLRGAPTPRIDSLADEGLRLLNFNVEAQCTPSRAAIMTGRYAIRTGNAEVPLGVGVYGLTQWEYTMAEMLSDAGYATGMFGKWHLGLLAGQRPLPSGGSSAGQVRVRHGGRARPDSYGAVMEAERGQTPTEREVYDTARRLTIDRDITDRTIDFIRRKAAGDRPFFAFVPYTQTHLPVEPHPDNKGKTGNGHWADVLAQTDAYVGEILDVVDELGIRDNTIFIFTADNGPEGAIPHQGFSGPWRGSYFTGLEGSLRVPFLVRWPGKIPADRVSNGIVHEMDLFATLAQIAGGTVPDDRVIDSLDQTAFFLGETDESARESVVVYVGRELYGVKWRDWKMMVKEISTIAGDPVRSYGVPLFYNLLLDPKEEHPVLHAPPNFWVRYPAGQVLVDHGASMQLERPIPPGTPDPYQPSR